ncbi:MAG: hypothetical protein HN457_15055, partial [Opitutales bacterium]|nr:hypothetical protein [Opitutales bacterium]
GLGNADSIESVTISWPTSKTKQVFENVELNQAYHIHENSKSLEPIKLPALRTQENPKHVHQH